MQRSKDFVQEKRQPQQKKQQLSSSLNSSKRPKDDNTVPADENNNKKKKLEEEKKKTRQLEEDHRLELIKGGSPIHMLTNDHLGHIISFLELQSWHGWLNEEPPLAGVLQIRETCRYFAQIVDWELILRNCYIGCYSVSFRVLENLYRKMGSKKIIVGLSANPNCKADQWRRNFLLLAVEKKNDVQDTDLVQHLLSHKECVVDRDILDKALLRDKYEIAEILQKDPHVQELIIPCSKCNKKPSCLSCRTDDGNQCELFPKSLYLCKSCTNGNICIVCEKHQCETCRKREFCFRYFRCSTCKEPVCALKGSGAGYDPDYCCFRECDMENCRNVQCLNCADTNNLNRHWYECGTASDFEDYGSNPHVLCQDCSPENVERETGKSEYHCPICYMKSQVACYISCCDNQAGLATIQDTLSGWFSCPDHPTTHVFCPDCNPQKVEYAQADKTVANQCIGCQNNGYTGVRKCKSYYQCGIMEKDIVQGSSEWWRGCPDHPTKHILCPGCNPKNNAEMHNFMLEVGMDIHGCPCCQGIGD